MSDQSSENGDFSRRRGSRLRRKRDLSIYQGLTKQDRFQHPVELKKLLVGGLSREMSVTMITRQGQEEELDLGDSRRQHTFLSSPTKLPPDFKQHGDESPSCPEEVISFCCAGRRRDLVCHAHKTSPVPEEQHELRIENVTGENYEFYEREQQQQQLEAESYYNPVSVNYEDYLLDNASQMIMAKEVYDPKTGMKRFMCRYKCGAYLASTAYRAKHEKFSCQRAPLAVKDRYRSNRNYPCQHCDKVLTTPEGFKVHLKVQHGIANGQNKTAEEDEGEEDLEEEEETEDKQQHGEEKNALKENVSAQVEAVVEDAEATKEDSANHKNEARTTESSKTDSVAVSSSEQKQRSDSEKDSAKEPEPEPEPEPESEPEPEGEEDEEDEEGEEENPIEVACDFEEEDSEPEPDKEGQKETVAVGDKQS